MQRDPCSSDKLRVQPSPSARSISSHLGTEADAKCSSCAPAEYDPPRTDTGRGALFLLIMAFGIFLLYCALRSL